MVIVMVGQFNGSVFMVYFLFFWRVMVGVGGLNGSDWRVFFWGG